MHTDLLNQVSLLSVDDQIELVEAIWDGIAQHGSPPILTAAQKAELERRLADDIAHPDEHESWESVKAAALAQIRQ